MRLSLLIGFILISTAAAAQESLRVSDDGRRILQPDGTPFFWLGDTAWELFHRLDREDADHFLEDRARKGFTVIQAVVLAEFDGLTEPNPYGALPLHDRDPARPNEAYFEHVDYIVARAEELGMFVGMLPTWGDKFNQRWGIGPEVFTPANARSYGEFLGRRYRDRPIIWILGGDRAPESDEHEAIIRAMAEGIGAGDGGRHLMTYHPMGGRKSWEWFHGDDWLDINMFQSGHSHYDAPNYRMIEEGYSLRPVKPVLDGEPRYEDHPVGWNPQKGWFDAFDVRQAGYWAMLAGAAGHTYGDHNIWQMLTEARPPVSSARTLWPEALSHAGAAQMGFMKRLFLSRPWADLVPDQSVLSGDAAEGAMHIRAARDQKGRYLIAYSPYGWPIEVDLSKISAQNVRAWWFDPRTGMATEIGTVEGPKRTFDPPGPGGRGNDWVLIVDDAAAGFTAPGRIE